MEELSPFCASEVFLDLRVAEYRHRLFFRLCPRGPEYWLEKQEVKGYATEGWMHQVHHAHRVSLLGIFSFSVWGLLEG